MLRRDRVIVALIVVQCAALAVLKVRSARSVYGTYTVETHIDSAMLVRDTRSLPDKKYTLVEFGDYQCPPCAHLSSDITKLLTKHPTKLKFCFRHFPLPMHPLAAYAAYFAEIARGRGVFERMHSELFGLDTKIGTQQLDALGRRYGINMDRLSSSEVAIAKSSVTADISLGNRVTIKGTPTLFLCTPDRKVFRLDSLALVEQIIN